jgi:protein arginine kinase activator
MQCEICKTKEANVHLKQAWDGLVKELHLCEDCAAEKGFDVHAPLSLTDFLLGGDQQQTPALSFEDRSCSFCHARWSDFNKMSRLGCSSCYEAFAEELKPVLASMHKGSRHIGKVPAAEAFTGEVASLQKALEAAVEAQNFEEAARLRDRLCELKAKRSTIEKTETIC